MKTLMTLPSRSVPILLLTKITTYISVSIQVEPARRAYAELGVQAVITGRRASQGGDRASLQPLEVDSTGLLKLNPLFEWSFPIVEWYITENNVPRNKLLSQGYRSVGDWHSTVKVGEGQGERAGRWVGREKTECGLHKDYFTMKKQAMRASAVSLISLDHANVLNQAFRNKIIFHGRTDAPVHASILSISSGFGQYQFRTKTIITLTRSFSSRPVIIMYTVIRVNQLWISIQLTLS